MANRCLIAAKRSGRSTWVGFVASEDTDPDLLERRRPADLEELIRSGALHVMMSLRNPAGVLWEPK